MNLIETQIESQTVYRGAFIDVFQDVVHLPNGQTANRIVVRHPGAACVLAITAEQQAVLVRQWRYPTGTALLELPAGKLDIKGEDPKNCALRELAEETPYTAENAVLLQTFYTAPGFCDEKMYLYYAENIVKNSQLNADDDEILECVLMNKDEVRHAIQNGEIQDAKTLIGLQYWLNQAA
ncbi:NUDIX hydrolase [Stenoxybacter acetivorans]|uniref:NUDIX hydrolase n=1 Tax=Stenoxybacter acetivorans TaxID=422441 RepID=UPI0005673A89|nr:NUDIX hydrolase [Stenoxybacter acetivorans]